MAPTLNTGVLKTRYMASLRSHMESTQYQGRSRFVKTPGQNIFVGDDPSHFSEKREQRIYASVGGNLPLKQSGQIKHTQLNTFTSEANNYEQNYCMLFFLTKDDLGLLRPQLVVVSGQRYCCPFQNLNVPQALNLWSMFMRGYMPSLQGYLLCPHALF